ncbi:ArsR/SmtB family transcription factor [Clostridium felsineum]|uniref:ArsR/SmtB family transcription factor n=1 Tax=Clostridium felsineum TaxID=36839 RepID=UPI00098C045E|nr:winged helix-turn-helix domain-containing protein [Clostridium felsineum]URZ18745.1 hypothetical protein CLFE_048330 [Clostridium felsineum DSM 794]
MIIIKIIDNIELIHSEALDFLGSLFRLNCDKDFFTSSDEKREFNTDILDWIYKSKEELPEEINKQINTFFNKETFYGMCLVTEIVKTKLSDIEAFLVHIKKLEVSRILSSFLSSGFNLDGMNISEMNSLVKTLLKDEKKAIDFINNNICIDSDKKWELLQFFIDPYKMKNDLVNLLEWYYKNMYIKILPEINKKVLNYEEELIHDIEINTKEYMEALTRRNYDSTSEIYVSASYFYEFAYLRSSLFTDAEYYLIGYRFKELNLKDSEALASLLKILKAIGDETRLNILKLLNEKPLYGKEIAQNLKLSNSTISYHLNSLIYNNFITENKVDNKIYYNFNSENMKKIVCDAVDKMLK